MRGKRFSYPCNFKVCKTSDRWEAADFDWFFFTSFLFVLWMLIMLSDLMVREEILFIEDVDSKLEEEESAKEEEEEDEDGHWVE